MKHIIYDNPFNKKNIIDDPLLYDYGLQLNYITSIYEMKSFNHYNYIYNNIKTKYNSYKQQDKLKKKYNPELHISIKQMIKKLYDCELRCYYCNCNLLIVYEKKKDPTQWSLERFDNNIGHYDLNTCISCLKCNLQRRTNNHEMFKYSKQLNICKLDILNI